ncbi:MAG: hypothetical protein K8I00_07310, partial [Candidatus Omnitrophica bacterium]|nr:hypothetical protein [Candidatus Omnitrophota bacterium]
MLARMVSGFGELMYRRHLDPPHHMTLDHYTMATFIRAEAFMFNKTTMAADIEAETFKEIRSKLDAIVRHLHDRRLLRVIRLALLLHTNGHISPAVMKTLTRILGARASNMIERGVKRMEVTLAMLMMGILPFSRDAKLVSWLVMNQKALTNRIRKGDNPADMQAFFRNVLGNDSTKLALLTFFTLVEQSVLQPEGIRQRLSDFYPVLEIELDRLSDEAYVGEALRQLQTKHTQQYFSSIIVDLLTGRRVSVKVNSTSATPQRGKTEEILIYVDPSEEDRPGILNKIAAVLIAKGFARRNYRVGQGPEGMIVDHFFVEHRFGSKVEWAVILEDMRLSIEAMIREEARPQDILRAHLEFAPENESEHQRNIRLNIVKELFEVPQNDIPTTITMSAATYRGERGTLLEVSTVNYSGWLYVLTSVLAQLGLNIHAGTGEVIGDPDIGQISYDTLLIQQKGKPLAADMQRKLQNKLADITRKERVTAVDWQAPDSTKLYTSPASVIISTIIALNVFNVAVPEVIMALAVGTASIILSVMIIRNMIARLNKRTQTAGVMTTRGPPAQAEDITEDLGSTRSFTNETKVTIGESGTVVKRATQYIAKTGTKAAIFITALAAGVLYPDTAYGFNEYATVIGEQGLNSLIAGSGIMTAMFGGILMTRGSAGAGDADKSDQEDIKSNPDGALAVGAAAGAPEPPRKKTWWERLLAFFMTFVRSRQAEVEQVFEQNKRVHSTMAVEKSSPRSLIDRFDRTILRRNLRGSDEASVRKAPTETKSAELMNLHHIRIAEEVEKLMKDLKKAEELLNKRNRTEIEKEIAELYEFLMDVKRDMERTPIERGGVKEYDLANDRIKQIHAAKVFLETARAFLEGRGEFNIISADTGIGKSDLAAAIARWMYRKTGGKVIILMNVPDAKVYDFLTHPLLIELAKAGGLRRVREGQSFKLKEGINVGDFKDSKELVSMKILNAESGKRVFEINDESDAFERSPDLIKGERRLEELLERKNSGDTEAVAELERLAKLEVVDRVKYRILDQMLRDVEGRKEMLFDVDKHGRPILRAAYLTPGEKLSPMARFYREYLRELGRLKAEGEDIIKETRKDITEQINAFVEAIYSRDNPNHGRDNSDLGIHMLTSNKFSQPGTIPGDANLARAIVIMEGLSSRNFKVAALSKVENAVKAADVHRLVGGAIGMTATAESMRLSAEIQGAKIFRHGKEDGLPDVLKLAFDRTEASYNRPGEPIVDLLLREVGSDAYNTKEARVTLVSLWNALGFRLLGERLKMTAKAEKGTDNVYRISEIKLSDGSTVKFNREKVVVIVGEDGKIKGQPDSIQEGRAKELIRRAQEDPNVELIVIQLGLSGGSNILKDIGGKAKTMANTLFIGSTATAEAIQFTSRANLPGKRVARLDINEAKLIISIDNDPNLNLTMRRDVKRAVEANDMKLQRYLAEKILSTL